MRERERERERERHRIVATLQWFPTPTLPLSNLSHIATRDLAFFYVDRGFKLHVIVVHALRLIQNEFKQVHTGKNEEHSE